MRIVHTLDEAEGVARAAAADFADLAREAVRARGRFTVALSGGSTPERLYQLLVEAPHRDRVPWSEVEFFWGDERGVPPDHPDSNYGLAAAGLLRKVPAAPERIHRIRGEGPDLDGAAQEYEAEIARVFGVPPGGPPPRFDLILLGMGSDGHTASLFPYSPALGEGSRWVVSHRVPGLAAERVTMTAPLLNAGWEIRVLVTGEDKASALRAVLKGPRDPDRLPAQLIAPGTGRVIWLVDEAAAVELRDRADPPRD
jgi:6-phosphogluconolactonase